MKITTSKQFSIDYRDILKGAVTSGLTSAGVIVQQLIDNGTLFQLNWKAVGMAAVGGFIGYLIKNYFTPSQVVAKVQPPETVEVVEKKVEEAVDQPKVDEKVS